jgi:hypothetical protein
MEVAPCLGAEIIKLMQVWPAFIGWISWLIGLAWSMAEGMPSVR